MISLPYIILIAILALCAYCYEYAEGERNKRLSTVLAVAVFYVFFAFRGYVATDWTSYTLVLENAEWSDFTEWSLDDTKVREPGFLLLLLLCKFIYKDFFFLVFVCISIDTVLLLRFLRRWNIGNVAFVLMVISTFGGPELLFNLLRNALAMFVILNALEYVTERKPLPYFLLCLLAISFHFSATIYLPLYFFLHLKINRWVYLGIFCFVVFFYFGNFSILMLLAKVLNIEGPITEKLEFYTEYYASSNSIRLLTVLEHTILVGFVVWFYDELIEKNRNRLLMMNSLIIFLVFNYVFAEFLVLSHRLALLFCFAYWILWYDISSTLYLEHNKKLMFGLFFLYCTFIQIGNFHEETMAYDNILFGHKSYEERLKIFNTTFEEFGK